MEKSGKLEFLRQRALSAGDIRTSEEHDEIIEGFLYSKTMTFLYAGKGRGKTWVALGLSAHVCEMGYEVIYLDADNSISTARDRKIDKLIERFNGRFWYVNADAFDDPKADTQAFLLDLKARATGGVFKKVLVVIDSLAFIVDDELNNDAKLHRVFAVGKAIRRDGGTILFLNHSTKKGEGMAGNAVIERNADAIYEGKNVNPTDETATHMVLIPEKFRLQVRETGWSVVKDTLALTPLDPDIAKLTSIELELAQRIGETIEKSEQGISQNSLLEAVGLAKNDRTGMRLLELLIGKNWSVSIGKRNSKIYKKIDKRDSANSENSREQKPTTTSVHTVRTVHGEEQKK